MVTNKFGCCKLWMWVCIQGIALYLNPLTPHFHKQFQKISIGNCMATYAISVEHISITLDRTYNQIQ